MDNDHGPIDPPDPYKGTDKESPNQTAAPPNPFAFPGSHPGGLGYISQNGMTLRDYFAAKTLQGIMSDYHIHPCNEIETANTARQCYQMADAMLHARLK